MLTGGDIPEGHYEDVSMERTVVPGRNTIFCAILSGLAESEGFEEIWLGLHAGDHAIYPDCRPGFYTSMRKTLHEATDGKVDLQAPFLYVTKADILKRGMELKVPYEKTRTCYKNQAIACGRCGSCSERRMSFDSLGLKDPIAYETPQFEDLVKV